MLEELKISFTQVIQARLSRSGFHKTVLRTFTIAGKQELTIFALGRQGIEFILAKTQLPLTIHHLYQRMSIDISQLIFRKDKMIARIHITIEFHDSCMSAGLGQRTDTRLTSHPVCQCSIEKLYKILSHILADPFIKIVHRKLPHCSGVMEKSASPPSVPSFTAARCLPSL